MDNQESSESLREQAIASFRRRGSTSGGQFRPDVGRAAYQSPSLRSLLVTAAFIALAGFAAYAIVKFVGIIQVMNQPDTWESVLRLLQLIEDLDSLSIISPVTSIAAGILFLFWLYRASTNLPTLGTRGEFTPGWTVAWFFIPIANLWKPYQAVKEIHEISDPGTEVLGSGRRSYSSTAIIGVWWALFIITVIGAEVILNMSVSLGLMYTLVAVEILSVVGMIVTVLVVLRITRFQDRKIDLVAPA